MSSMTSPIIAVYVSTATDKISPHFNDAYYALAYADLFKLIINKGGIPIVVYDAETNYMGEGKFAQYWQAVCVDGNISYKSKNEQIKANLVYNKSCFPTDDVKLINSNDVKKTCNNKYLSYLLTPDFHPRSFLVLDEGQMKTLLVSYKGQNVAIKELDSNGGEKVFVGKAESFKNIDFNFPLLFQEFIDTSGGARGLASGIHDVRVGMFDEEPICGLLRQPSKMGELRTNYALGGHAKELYMHELPEELIEKTREIATRLNPIGPCFFSADWGFDKKSNEWKLFEINNAPGLAHESVDGPAANEYLDMLSDSLMRAARDNY